LKILFYNHTGQVSGAERVLLMTLAGLDRSRFDPVVLCPADGQLIQMINGLRIKTAGMNPLAARFTWRPDRLIRYFASFARVIRRARAEVVRETPDLIHANSIRAGLVMSAATVGLGTPIVWHAHDLLPRHPLSTAIRLFALASRRNRIIAVSQAVSVRFRGVLLRRFPRRAPVTTIHNAVDPERFQPNVETRDELRRALGIKKSQLLVGTVGQLTPRKGQLEVIEAFTEVAREIPDAVLLIVGQPIFNRDAEYAASLVRAANVSNVPDQIRLLGPREDVPALMRAFDLLVVNSRSEPFGLTIVEAMLSGTPVLAAAVDGIPEIVRHGESGWLIDGRDHRSLAEAMLTLLRDQNLRRKLGSTGRRDAIQRFSIDRFMTEVLALYGAVYESDKRPEFQNARGIEVQRVAGASRP
jgi:glycosyltransferase involved in cell wall biosynthesis